MSKKIKLLQKALNNPDGLSLEDFCVLMKHHGWVLDHQRGSHQIWYSPKSYRISVQDRNGKAKGYQVKQFLSRLLEEESEDNA
jgi:predicted RNA binding protein YcfA (HicA-like mRNA interferase family)